MTNVKTILCVTSPVQSSILAIDCDERQRAAKLKRVKQVLTFRVKHF